MFTSTRTDTKKNEVQASVYDLSTQEVRQENSPEFKPGQVTQ